MFRSDVVGLELHGQGRELRWVDPKTGSSLPTALELSRLVEDQSRRAQEEARRADSQRARAEAAEAELARLREELLRLRPS